MDESRLQDRRRSLAIICVAVVALLGVLGLRAIAATRRSPAADSGQSITDVEAKALSSSKSALAKRSYAPAGGAAGMSGEASIQRAITPIPPLGTRAKRKLWVRSKYGDGEDQLGFGPLPEGGEGEARVPQGFAITREGDLLVLDSEKQRLVWFDPNAQIKRKVALEELVMPADVGIAEDGTIAVIDHEGLHTKGTLLLTPEGKTKGMLPQVGAAALEMYVVGNDIFDCLGGSSIKLGDTSGVPSHETPNIYQQDGTIPGQVAPDGRTVMDAGIESKPEGRFFLSVLRNNPPEHIYTRQYLVPVKRSLFGISYLQADTLGTIYVVLSYDDFESLLLCVDLETGNPLGAVRIADDDLMTGAAVRHYTVNREQGGLIYHHLLEGESRFEVYDCR